MITKDDLKQEIEQLDDGYLELLLQHSLMNKKSSQ
jgi:hypothetical protein